MRILSTASMALAALLSLPLVSQAGPTLGPTYSAREFPPAIEEAWGEYRTLQEAGNIAGAAAVREKLTAASALQGVNRFDRIAAVLLQQAGSALSSGDTKRALELGGEALLWSPTYPDGHFFMAAAKAKEGFLLSPGAVKHYFAGLSSSARDFWAAYYLLRRAVLIVSFALMASILIFTVVLWIRYTPLWVHTLYETGLIHRPVAWALIFAAPVLLLLSGVGPLLVLVALLSFFWMFMPRGERGISVFIVLWLGFSSFWAAPLHSFLIGEGSLSLRLLSQVAEGNPSASGTAGEMQSQGGYEGDWEVIFSMGLQSKREGHTEKAAALYRKAQTLAPNEPIIPNNLGTIYLSMKLYQPAIDSLKQSISLDSKNVAAHYNLNLVYQELLKFEEASQAYAKAQAINKTLVESYSNKGREAVDAVLPAKLFWRRLFLGGGDHGTGSTGLLAGLFSPIAPDSSPIILAGGAVLVLLFRLILNAKRIAISCALCSRSICFHCQRRLIDLRVCQSCWAPLKNVKRKAELPLLQSKIVRTRGLGLVLSLLLPGVGNLYRKQSISGFVFVLIFLAGLLELLIGSDFLPSPGIRTINPMMGTMPIIVMMAAIYLWSVRRVRKSIVKS